METETPGLVAGVTPYSVYILRCGDGSYYTGIATDVSRRMQEHRAGPRGAKYLRGRGPLELVFSCQVGDRATASQLEFRIKRLSRDGKQRLIDGDVDIDALLADQEPAVS